MARYKKPTKKCKVVILSCIWQREHVTRMFLWCVERAIKYNNWLDIETVIVGSEGEKSQSLCEEWGVHYLEHRNEPLSNKWNAGALVARAMEPDYILILGSDDLMSVNFLGNYSQFILDKIDYIGLQDFYFCDYTTRDVGYWRGYDNWRMGEPIGAGRMLSSRLLRKLEWRPWKGGLKNSLDYSTTQKIDKHKSASHGLIRIGDTDSYLVDVKTEVNLSPFDRYKCDAVDQHHIEKINDLLDAATAATSRA